MIGRLAGESGFALVAVGERELIAQLGVLLAQPAVLVEQALDALAQRRLA